MDLEERPPKIRRLESPPAARSSNPALQAPALEQDHNQNPHSPSMIKPPKLVPTTVTELIYSACITHTLDREPIAEHANTAAETGQASSAEAPKSKSQQKKLRKKLEWEAGREGRKAIKKEKLKERKRVKREGCRNGGVEYREGQKFDEVAEPGAGDKLGPEASAEGHTQGEKASRLEGHIKDDANSQLKAAPTTASKRSSQRHPSSPPPRRIPSTLVPISLLLDCSFDDLMLERERISLASQVTRCHAENQRARYRVHLAISSFGGRLQNRFETVLAGQHTAWRGVRFLADGCAEVAHGAGAWMASREGGGTLRGALAKAEDGSGDGDGDDNNAHDVEMAAATETAAAAAGEAEVIYLTSDSPNILTELKPYGTYIIGGIVDRNRHKGICFRRAEEQGLRTARLPIGEYMRMNSRFVLTTNHVCEILLKWLELGDWGEAFMRVMPKRKGGVLREGSRKERGGDDEETEGMKTVERIGGSKADDRSAEKEVRNEEKMEMEAEREKRRAENEQTERERQEEMIL